MSTTRKQCARCQQPKPNVGLWTEGEFAGKELCGICKGQLALARPGAKARMEAVFRTIITEVQVVVIPLSEGRTSDADAVRALRDMHTDTKNPIPGVFLGMAAGARFYSLPRNGAPVFAAFLSLPRIPVPPVDAPSSLVEHGARAAARALPAGIERLAQYVEVIDPATGRALVVKDTAGSPRILARASEPPRR